MPKFLRTLAIISDQRAGVAGSSIWSTSGRAANPRRRTVQSGLKNSAGDLLGVLAGQVDDGGRDPLGAGRALSAVSSRRPSVMRVCADGEMALTVTP